MYRYPRIFPNSLSVSLSTICWYCMPSSIHVLVIILFFFFSGKIVNRYTPLVKTYGRFHDSHKTPTRRKGDIRLSHSMYNFAPAWSFHKPPFFQSFHDSILKRLLQVHLPPPVCLIHEFVERLDSSYHFSISFGMMWKNNSWSDSYLCVCRCLKKCSVHRHSYRIS